MSTRLVQYDKVFLDLSWKWLNDEEIRKLTETPKITREEQFNWFNNLSKENNYLIWGIEYDSTPVGACGLKNITKLDAEYWGYIGEKTYWGKGIGTEVLELMQLKAKELKLNSIWLKVTENNERAINLYKKMGFKSFKQDKHLIIMIKPL